MPNIISRITIWAAGQILKAADLNGEFNNIVNVINNVNSGVTSLTSPTLLADPTTSLGVTTKQYVDHYATYRRPVLQYNSSTVVNVETGLNGSVGQLQILFPDGTIRTDSTALRIQCDLTRNASLTGTAQSGLRTGSVAANTWYAIYAVKSQVNSTDIVVVADTFPPVQTNFSNINSNFGANSWVYLGFIRYGDNSGATTVILDFVQAGNLTMFRNSSAGHVFNAGHGIRIASTAGATSLTYTYSSGTGITDIPINIPIGVFHAGANSGSSNTTITDAAASVDYFAIAGTSEVLFSFSGPASPGVKVANGSSVAMDIFIAGFVDGVLGVGSNPIL